jgi:hypothetical protein
MPDYVLDSWSCKHDVVFDQEEAERILGDWTPSSAQDFVMGNPNTHKVRERFPRGVFPPEAPCKHCGFVGTAYASMSHYVMGDW